MSLFTLHQRVMEEYEQFVHSFVQIADARVRAYAEQVIRDERALWPAPMLQLSPAYQYGVTLDALVQQGVLHPDTGRIFRTRTGEPLRLYAHQERALRLASHGRSYVVTSGTGSGKSFTYLIPIIDYLLRHPDERGHVVALILYPMNALVNSQLRALESLREQYGQRFPITFAKYTGETLREQREQMRQQPPQICSTNYMMGELLMVRREDQPAVWAAHAALLGVRRAAHLSGRQGADVAMLVRRLKERYGAPDLVHIGTSATMVASEDATQAERRQAVAQFAASFFGHPFDADTVVDEVLAPATEGGEPTDAELHAVWGQPFPDTLDDLRRHPLARWIEWTFGLERDAAGNLRRRTPRTLREACESLAQRLGAAPRRLRTVGAEFPGSPGARASGGRPAPVRVQAAPVHQPVAPAARHAGAARPAQVQPRCAASGRIGRALHPALLLPPLRAGLLPRHARRQFTRGNQHGRKPRRRGGNAGLLDLRRLVY
jgi:hypothetical protein